MQQFNYFIKFFPLFISAATGAAASGCSGTVNAADQVGLLGFHNAVCSQGKPLVYMIQLGLILSVGIPSLNWFVNAVKDMGF